MVSQTIEQVIVESEGTGKTFQKESGELELMKALLLYDSAKAYELAGQYAIQPYLIEE